MKKFGKLIIIFEGESKLLVAGRTEHNVIFISFASESAGAIIKCIAISSWTSLLENCGIERGLACCWISILSTATVLI